MLKYGRLTTPKHTSVGIKYAIAGSLASIKPTIYLVDEGVEVNQETGQPVFSQIKTFVLSLLEEVKQEYNSYGEIDEL